MFHVLRRLFESPGQRASRKQLQRLSRQPLPTYPPRLPTPNSAYALFTTDEVSFDLYDGEDTVGTLIKHEGDGERRAVWTFELKDQFLFTFAEREEALAYLGDLPIRSHR